MFAALLGMALMGAFGLPSLVALLFGAAAGVLAMRVILAPPWTATGRRRWRVGARDLRASVGRVRQLWRSRRPRAAWVPPPPPGGWPGGPGSAVPGQGAEAAGAPVAEASMPVGAELRVRCEIVTPRLQVWHSTDTGRAYEVPTERGLAGAVPGDVALLRFERGRPRVVAPRVN
jgi:hypothetical protein